jgi:ABC-type lipoprotein export system ATPase subunit/GNAT superfamily N-acetyltransferase
MSNHNIIVKSKIKESFKTKQVSGMFDVPEKKEIVCEWNVELPINEKDWKIGLIIGPSGSGKTTIAKNIFKNDYFHESFNWDSEAAIIDGFGQIDTKTVVEALSSVGLSSPPHWLKPFGHLSNGQKFRCELAKTILLEHEKVVFDEFTSIVDRDVAKICCVALSKTIRRRQRPQFVAVSCHYDIIDWLQPDWIFDVAANRFEWRRLQRFPKVILNLHETNTRAWKVFRGHHYLSAEISPQAKCFVALFENKPVAFSSYIHMPHAIITNAKREHRTVVLPDFQGIGIGNKISEAVASYVTKNGAKYYSTTSHPAMINHRKKSPKWRALRFGHSPPSSKSELKKGMTRSNKRVTAGFQYVT